MEGGTRMCKDVWVLFKKILDKEEDSSEDSLDAFLVKVPDFLEKFPENFVPDECEDGFREKREFVLWLVRKMLFLRSERTEVILFKLLRPLQTRSPKLSAEILRGFKDTLEKSPTDFITLKVLNLLRELRTCDAPTLFPLATKLLAHGTPPIKLRSLRLIESLLLRFKADQLELPVNAGLLDVTFALYSTYYIEETRALYTDEIYDALRRVIELLLRDETSIFLLNEILGLWEDTIIPQWETFVQHDDELSVLAWKCLRMISKLPSLDLIIDFFFKKEYLNSEAASLFGTRILHECNRESAKSLGHASSTWKNIVSIYEKAAKGEDRPVFYRTLRTVAKVSRFLASEREEWVWSFHNEEIYKEICQCLFESVLTDSLVMDVAVNVYFDWLSTKDSSLEPSWQLIVATISLPWRIPSGSKPLDLKVNKHLWKCILKGIASCDKLEKIKIKIVYLLAVLPKFVCPKWRIFLLRQIWSDSDSVYCEALMSHLPYLIYNLSPEACSLADEIILQTLNLEHKGLCLELTKIAPMLICGRAPDALVLRFKGGAYNIQCSYCLNRRNDRRYVPQSSVASLLNLIGLSTSPAHLVVKMILPWSVHVGFSKDTARLWMNFFENEEYSHFYPAFVPYFSEFEEPLKEQLSRIRSSNPDGVLVDVLLALCDIKEATLTEYLIEELTSLYLDTDTHVSTYVRSQEFLRSNLIKYKSIILKRASDAIVVKESASRTLNLLTVLFRSSKSSVFLTQNMHYILPAAVLKRSKTALGFLSENSGISLRHLIVENFQYIFPSIVVHSKDSKDNIACIKFIETVTKVPLKELLPSKRQRVTTELILHFHSHQKRILSALNWLAENDSEDNTSSSKKNTKDVRKYLEPKLLGILGFMNQKLTSPNVSQERKKYLLDSLEHLMNFLGSSYIGSVKHKILSILQSAEGSEKGLVKCWETFTKRALDSSALGSIICEVLANLVPLLQKKNRSDVVKIFEDIIVQREMDFKDHFHKLYFLPDIVELEEVDRTISRVNRLQNLPCRELLVITSASMDSKNLQVQLQGLNKLKTILRLNINPVQGLIVASDTTDPFITSLILRLIQGSKRRCGEALSSLYGQCLGELGAIDPGRLHPLESVQSEDCEKETEDETSSSHALDEAFATSLLCTLVRGYLSSSDSSDADSYAYSIQEILKKFKIRPHSSRLWSSFSDETKEVLSPFLTSLYSCTEKPISSSYCYSSFTSFSEWLVNWSCHLIGKISDNRTRELMVVCKPSLRKDVVVAKFILPYIIIEVLIRGDGSCGESTYMEVMEVVESEKEFKRDALAVIFSILDHCNTYLRQRYEVMAGKMKTSDVPDKLKARDIEYSTIETFVKKIPSVPISLSSFECQAYTRSLMHYEHYLQTMKVGCLDDPKDLFMLQRLYGALEESDFVVGISRSRKTDPTLEETIHMYEVTGDYHDALACYESLGKTTSGMIRCYLENDQPSIAYSLSKSCDDVNEEKVRILQIEAAWQLSKWEDIDKLSDKKPCWEMDLARLVNFVQLKDLNRFYLLLEEARNRVMIPISATTGDDRGAYAHSYQHLIRLQILNEIEILAANFIFPKSVENMRDDLLLLLKTRLEYCQYSLAYQEPVLRLRKALFEIAVNVRPEKEVRRRLKSELVWTWRMSAKVARKAGRLQKSFNLLTQAATKFGADNLEIVVENAKLFWARGESDEGVRLLKKVVMCPISEDNKGLISEAKLLLARYLDDGASLDAESVVAYYKDARESLPGCESAFYFSAKFFDKMIGKNYKDSDLDSKGDFVYHVILLYGKTLIFGCNFLHEALPRILSLWLDFGARVSAFRPSDGRAQYESMTTNLDRINRVMSKVVDKWPAYYLLTAFPQLTSRICHPHQVCWANLKKILLKAYVNHPQHVFWHMVALSRSSYEMRKQRCIEILRGARENIKFSEDAFKFTETFLKLCTIQLDFKAKSLKKEMPEFFRLMNSKEFSRIMMPVTRNMTMMLPTSSDASKSLHNPFPLGHVMFEKPEDSLTVMKSLIRPKKVTFLGSNGKKYSFLCKPKDDLRRDCRLIDFNNLLNKLLTKDPESRKRDLHIRTYTVFPLDELNGIIEWMENLVLLRHVLVGLYKEKIGSKASLSAEEYRLYETSRTDFERNMKNFKILKKRFHPPVFGEWFVRNFPDPQAWYASRLAYVRTTAVMSMVCYLFGLGDRHAENIMFDSKKGDTVHVDLNCLFNKGDTLAIPEVVPFRLTQNMVHAMGPLGVEGPFRIACETSLSLMRKEKDVLNSTLRPFYFDPLLDWIQKSESASKSKGEAVNEKAVSALKNIENRLNGYVECRKKNNKKTLSSMPLSVSGQVNFLINEATSEDNLSQMFLGWAPYL